MRGTITPIKHCPRTAGGAGADNQQHRGQAGAGWQGLCAGNSAWQLTSRADVARVEPRLVAVAGDPLGDAPRWARFFLRVDERSCAGDGILAQLLGGSLLLLRALLGPLRVRVRPSKHLKWPIWRPMAWILADGGDDGPPCRRPFAACSWLDCPSRTRIQARLRVARECPLRVPFLCSCMHVPRADTCSYIVV